MAWEDRGYNAESSFDRGVPKLIFPMPSWLTLCLIVSNLAIFLVGALSGSRFYSWFDLDFLPGNYSHSFVQPWRWMTNLFLHGDGRHIFFNLIAIYFFVPMVERMWGWRKTLVFYILGGVAGGVTAMALAFATGWPLILIGASGAILSLLGAATYLQPEAQILAMMVIPITMRTFAILATIFYTLLIVGNHSLADGAHLGGLAFGYFAVMFAGARFGLLGQEAWQVAAPKPWRSKFRPTAHKIEQADKLRRTEMSERERIDEILAKVSASGMQSLNYLEKRALKKATENQRKRDVELSKLR